MCTRKKPKQRKRNTATQKLSRWTSYLTANGSSQRSAGELRAAGLALRVAARARAAAAASTAATTTTSAAATATLALEGVGCALCALLERALVGLDESRGLVREGEGQRLETAELDALAEDEVQRDLVQRGGELLVADHLGDNGRDLGVVELEHAAERLDGEGVVEGGVGEEVGAQTLLLDLLGQHRLDVLGVGHQLPDLDAVDELGRLLPLAGGIPCG